MRLEYGNGVITGAKDRMWLDDSGLAVGPREPSKDNIVIDYRSDFYRIDRNSRWIYYVADYVDGGRLDLVR